MRINPILYYHTTGHKPEPLKMKCAAVAAAVGSNVSLVAAASGKIHRVMGLMATSQHSANDAIIQLNSDTASPSTILEGFTALSRANGLPTILPITESGYCETEVGEALACDVAAADVYLNIFYVTYTA